ncbi:hypothetical protein QYM36_007103 [Artemia franciscana]|nr:hypothetical protein QYM36_007103 [Artemia franciscana]
MKASKSPLLAKLRTKAETLEDRVNILDARDSLIKKKKVAVKNEDGYFIGTCPDMCPEKERYYRKMLNEIKPYEMDQSNSENLQYCIKKYSRSAADKDVVSHELRPADVLQLTMNHIINCIIPQGEMNPDNLPNWYDFVWDRTRAIRTDISVQGLKDDVSVSIVEKITRFHIHCAFRLVQFEASQFDQKLNSENLTKSLITLREMYQRRRLERIESPNEAEFHAYHLLLQLKNNQGFTSGLTDGKHLSHTQPIKFALSIWRAFRFNNAVLFFRLIKNEATYLQAALLKRYFGDVRFRALKILQKACGMKQLLNVYPAVEFREAMCFDQEELEEFLMLAGTSIDKEENIMLSEVSNSLTSEVSVLSSIIQEKLHQNIAEIINGGLLEPDRCQEHIPHDSFDSNGFLKREAKQALDQGLIPGQVPLSRRVRSEGEVSESDEDEPYKIVDRATLSAPQLKVASPVREILRRKEPEIKVPHLIKEVPPLSFKTMREGKRIQSPFKVSQEPQISFPSVVVEPVFQPVVTTTPTATITTLSSIFHTFHANATPVVTKIETPKLPPAFSITKPSEKRNTVFSTFTLQPTTSKPAPPLQVLALSPEKKSPEDGKEKAEVARVTGSPEFKIFLDALNDSVPKIVNTLLEETVEKLIKGVAWEFFEYEVKPIRVVSQEMLDQILQNIVNHELLFIIQMEKEIETNRVIMTCRDHLLAFKYVRRWQKFIRKKKKRRQSIESFPAYCSFLPIADQLKKIGRTKVGITPDELVQLETQTKNAISKIELLNEIERQAREIVLSVPLIIGKALLEVRSSMLSKPDQRNYVTIKSNISFKLLVVSTGRFSKLYDSYFKSKLLRYQDKETDEGFMMIAKPDPYHSITVKAQFIEENKFTHSSISLEYFDAILIGCDSAEIEKLNHMLQGSNFGFLADCDTDLDSGKYFKCTFKKEDVHAMLQV